MLQFVCLSVTCLSAAYVRQLRVEFMKFGEGILVDTENNRLDFENNSPKFRALRPRIDFCCNVVLK